MRRSGFARRCAAHLALWLALPLAAPAAAEPAQPPAPIEPDMEALEIMAGMVEALQVALPPSLSAEKFQDPKRREEILAALAKLAASGERLEDHGAGSEASFAFLSHSLATDVRDIERRYAEGRYAEARFLLHHVTDVCVACHSRLPDDRTRRLGRRLIADDAVAALPADERAQFEMATRQFDAALASFDELFADPQVAPVDLDLMGHFESYLELCLRVQHDPQRAIRTFERLEQRTDLPLRVRANVDAWITSLEELRSRRPAELPLVEARRLIAQAQDRERYADERRALVPFIAASGVLHRYVATQGHATRDVGEAYYLLGVVEANVGRSFWASQTEHFLETAIRIAPGEPYAEDAYALLEEFVVAGYTGSAGVNVPPEVRRRLAELRQLIDTAAES